MVVADLRRQFQISAQEGGAQVGHGFLARIAFVAPSLAAEIALQLRGF